MKWVDLILGLVWSAVTCIASIYALTYLPSDQRAAFVAVMTALIIIERRQSHDPR